MNRRVVTLGLGAVVLLQLGVLATEYVGAVHPLWTGREVRLETVPVDPRSLFRGNYAQLRYRISDVDPDFGGDDRFLRNGEVIYVKLKPAGKDGIYEYAGVSLDKPAEGLFIRGRIQTPRWITGEGVFSVRYGIEAFFAPREKALELEKELRHGAVALVMVSASGRARLKDIVSR